MKNTFRDYSLLKETKKSIPLFYPHIPKNAKKAVSKVLSTRWLGQGPLVDKFENVFSNKFCSKLPTVAVGSGTDALHLSYILSGIKKNDEIICPVFTCTATNIPLLYIDAKIKFADIDPITFNISIEHVEKLITKKTKAIIPLHYAGIPCEQKEVYELAKKHNLRIMEDCCHAIGTKIKGKKIGSYGDIAVFSFDPVKTITSIDGGCIIVNDKKEKKIAENLRLLGMNKDTIERYKNKRAWIYDVVSEGYRYHMTNILASIGISQLNRLDEFITSRQKICKLYNESFREIPDLVTPKSDFNDISPFIYTPRILNQRREKFIDHMNKLKIDIGIHWNPIHRFSYFSKSKKDELSITNKIADEICTIPLHSNMRSEHVNRVINGVKSFFKS